MTTLENIKQKIEEINKKKEELISELRSDFGPMLKPLFDKSDGKITSIGWTQYTPDFNDGDECVFCVNLGLKYEIRVNGYTLDEQEELFGSSLYALSKYGTYLYDSWIAKYPEDKINEETKENDLFLYVIIQEFEKILLSIDDEFYKELFGDHVIVTVYADGRIETEEYYHD